MFAFIFVGIIISEIVFAQNKQKLYFTILKKCYSLACFIYSYADDREKEMMICEK